MTRLAIAAGLVVAIGLVLLAAYRAGQDGERSKAAARDARELTEQVKDRSQTDEEVDRMSAADLCARLGGLWRNGKCE
jgi:hypothetical protein